MTKKKATVVAKGSTLAARKRARKVGHKLIRRERTDLQLKDYLMEEHPELGLPRDDAQVGTIDPASRIEKT